MASFYWYERDPELWQTEILAMQTFFPQFRYSKLEDGRLTWIGTVNPRGRAGLPWTLQLVYSNNHPSNSSYGGSILVYPIDPSLDDLAKKLGTLPHVLRDSSGHLCICTARQQDFQVSASSTTTAASALGWACKWIFVFEEWVMEGNVGNEIFGHIY